MKHSKKKYISIKLPAGVDFYPVDRLGHRKLPNYTSDYLKKHGRKLFEILFHQVPSTVYSELIRCIKANEKIDL